MSLQWTLVAGLLYTEIAFLIILILPFIKSYMWQKLFRSRVVKLITSYGYIYSNVMLFILVLLFLDAIREVRKYSVGMNEMHLDMTVNPHAEVMVHAKLFRAQRNLYIAGFAFFLWIVLKRMSALISAEATLIASNEATKKQAESASDLAKKLMEDKEELEAQLKDQIKTPRRTSRSGSLADVAVAAVAVNETTKELHTVRQELQESKAALEKAETDLAALKKQAEGTNAEYDRLLKEHSALQAKFDHSESKKDM